MRKQIRNMKKITKSVEETFLYAKELLSIIKPETILCLSGEIGAGKTTLTQGIAQTLGIKKHIQSPTFTLYRVYPVKKHHFIKQLCHIDAYRLSNENPIADLGLENYLTDPETLCVIEWPEIIMSSLKKYKNKIIIITLRQGTKNSTRIIQINNPKQNLAPL